MKVLVVVVEDVVVEAEASGFLPSVITVVVFLRSQSSVAVIRDKIIGVPTFSCACVKQDVNNS